MTVLLLVLILFVLIMILGNQNQVRAEKYFDEHRLPDGSKVSRMGWVEKGIFACFAVGILYGIITKNIAGALGWAFLTLIVIANAGPYFELWRANRG